MSEPGLGNRRSELFTAAAAGSVSAAAELLDIGIDHRIQSLPVERLQQWESDKSPHGLRTVRQIYGVLLGEWALRQHSMPKDAVQSKLEAAIECITADALTDPVVLCHTANFHEQIRPEASEKTSTYQDECLTACRASDLSGATLAVANLHLITAHCMTQKMCGDWAAVDRMLDEAEAIYGDADDTCGLAHVAEARGFRTMAAMDGSDHWGRAAGLLQESAEKFSIVGDSFSAGSAWQSAVILASRGQVPGPMTEDIRQALANAGQEFRAAGCDDYAKRVDQWAADPIHQGGCLGMLVSAGFLVLLVVAFFKGNDALLFLALLGVCILIHECGHWLAAIMVGIPIRRFRVGLGTRLLSFRLGMTRVEVCAIPFLGYVMPATISARAFEDRRQSRDQPGDSPEMPPVVDLEAESEPWQNFIARPRRALFYSGGLIVNFVAAVLFLWGHGEVMTPADRSAPAIPAVAQTVAERGVEFIVELPRMMSEEVARTEAEPEANQWIRKAAGKSRWHLLLIFGIANCLLLYLNIMPIPPLDGYHLLCVSISAVTRRELSKRAKELITTVGYSVLALWIVLNLYVFLRGLLRSIFS